MSITVEERQRIFGEQGYEALCAALGMEPIIVPDLPRR